MKVSKYNVPETESIQNDGYNDFVKKKKSKLFKILIQYYIIFVKFYIMFHVISSNDTCDIIRNIFFN